MGCDIHCYLEYRLPGSETWLSYSGRMNPGRNYDLFFALAGVRGEDRSERGPTPKGMPDNPGFYAGWENSLCVSDKEGEDLISRENAENLVNRGISKWVDGDHKLITHPDWHSHSWATLDEFAQAIKTAESERYQLHMYRALLAMMKYLDDVGREVRLVYWFDN